MRRLMTAVILILIAFSLFYPTPPDRAVGQTVPQPTQALRLPIILKAPTPTANPTEAPAADTPTPTVTATPTRTPPVSGASPAPPRHTATATQTATMTAIATATPTVTPTATNSAPSGPCPCSSDSRNCSSFNTQSAAQACYNFCVSQGAGDIHRLDSDNDGVACESLPGQLRVIR